MATDAIAGDRRGNRRYDIQLELRWKLIRRKRVLEAGTGRTIDVSSGGLRIDAGKALDAGVEVELSIAWPVLLHQTAPLQLVVNGRIERTTGTQAGIRIVRHEFRTAGGLGDQRNWAGTVRQVFEARDVRVAGSHRMH